MGISGCSPNASWPQEIKAFLGNHFKVVGYRMGINIVLVFSSWEFKGGQPPKCHLKLPGNSPGGLWSQWLAICSGKRGIGGRGDPEVSDEHWTEIVAASDFENRISIFRGRIFILSHTPHNKGYIPTFRDIPGSSRYVKNMPKLVGFLGEEAHIWYTKGRSRYILPVCFILSKIVSQTIGQHTPISHTQSANPPATPIMKENSSLAFWVKVAFWGCVQHPKVRCFTKTAFEKRISINSAPQTHRISVQVFCFTENHNQELGFGRKQLGADGKSEPESISPKWCFFHGDSLWPIGLHLVDFCGKCRVFTMGWSKQFRPVPKMEGFLVTWNSRLFWEWDFTPLHQPYPYGLYR